MSDGRPEDGKHSLRLSLSQRFAKPINGETESWFANAYKIIIRIRTEAVADALR